MIDQDRGVWTDMSIRFAIDGQLVSANHHVGVATGPKPVGRSTVPIVHFFRRGNAGSITVGHHDGVSANRRLYPSQ